MRKSSWPTGFGVDRHQVMYNDFVLIGPAADPAGVKGKDIPTALKTFAEKKIPFVSRGDNSGTHNTEKQLWKVAGMEVPARTPRGTLTPARA